MSVILDITRQVGVNLSSIGSGWFVDKDQGQITEKIYTAVDNIDSGLVDAAVEAAGFDRIPEEKLPSMQGEYTALDFAKNNFVLSPGLNDKDSKLVIMKDMSSLRDDLGIEISGGMSNLQYKVDLTGGYSKKKGSSSSSVKMLFYYYNRTHSLGLRNLERLKTNQNLLKEERGVNRPLHYISDIYYGYNMYITLELSSEDSDLKEKIEATADGTMTYGALTAHIQGKFDSNNETDSSTLNMTLTNSSKGLSGCPVDLVSVLGREYQHPTDYIAYIEKLESYLDNFIANNKDSIKPVPVAFGILPIPFNSLDLNFEANSDYTSFYQTQLQYLNEEYILLQDNLAKIASYQAAIEEMRDLPSEYHGVTYPHYLRQLYSQCKAKERNYSHSLFALQQLRFDNTQNSQNIKLLQEIVQEYLLVEGGESEMSRLEYDLRDFKASYTPYIIVPEVKNLFRLQMGKVHFRDSVIRDGNGDRELSIDVVFPKQFAEVPSVYVSFNRLDTASEWNTRVNTRVTDVSTTGCTITIETWCQSRIYSAGINWTAITDNQ